MSKVLNLRFASIFSKNFDQYRFDSSKIKVCINNIGGQIRSGKLILESEIDVKDKSSLEEKNWLTNTIKTNKKVMVIWVTYSEAALLDFHDFVKFHEDLWLPSAEDIWIIDQIDYSWVLELDHEEIFRLYKK